MDAIADRELTAELDWISPIAAVNFRGMGLSEKTFPGARDAEEAGSTAASRHERYGRDRHRERAQDAADSGSRQLHAQRQARGLRAERQRIS